MVTPTQPPWIQSVPTYPSTTPLGDVLLDLHCSAPVPPLATGERLVILGDRHQPPSLLYLQDLVAIMAQTLDPRTGGTTGTLPALPALGSLSQRRSLTLLPCPSAFTDPWVLWSSLEFTPGKPGDYGFIHPSTGEFLGLLDYGSLLAAMVSRQLLGQDGPGPEAPHAEPGTLKSGDDWSGDDWSGLPHLPSDSEGWRTNDRGLDHRITCDRPAHDRLTHPPGSSDRGSLTLANASVPLEPQPTANRTAAPANVSALPLPPEDGESPQTLAAQNITLFHLNALKDKLLLRVSHELKTPITAILGLSTLLKEQTAGTLTETQTYYARLIHHSGRQLMLIVNDVLDLTRLETQSLTLNPHPINLPEAFDLALIKAKQWLLETQDVAPPSPLDASPVATDTATYRLDIPRQIPPFSADPLRFQQMVAHLLSNAFKFTGAEGSVTLQVRPWGDRWMAFNVTDTGQGIAPPQQTLLLHQEPDTCTDYQPLTQGAGLGLMLTQRLAQIHGGDLSFRSQLGQGSQFTLILPLQPQRSAIDSLALDPGASPADAGRRCFLLVTQNPHHIDHLVKCLSALNYDWLVARSRLEALEKIRRFRPWHIFLGEDLETFVDGPWQAALQRDDRPIGLSLLRSADTAPLDSRRSWTNQGPDPTSTYPVLPLPTTLQTLQIHLHPYQIIEPPSPPSNTPLTILCLRVCAADGTALSSSLLTALPSHLPQLLPQHRVLEAQDLEQANLLTRIWNPQVLLLDTSACSDPFSYVNQLQAYPALSQLPIITFDSLTTAAANQVPHLTVFPCLVLESAQPVIPKQLTDVLLPVIQMAAIYTIAPP